MAHANPENARGCLKDVLLYIAIAVSLVTLLLLYAIHQGRARQTSGLPLKWFGFAIMTALVFGNAIFRSNPAWDRSKFWKLLAVFSVLHFGLGFAILWHLHQVGLIDFFIVTFIEYAALNAYLGHFLNRAN